MSAYHYDGGKEYFRDGEDAKEAKDTAGKPQLTLVPSAIIWAIADVREYGTKKYGDPAPRLYPPQSSFGADTIPI